MAIYFLIIANSIPIRKFYFHTKRLYTTSLHPKFSTKKKLFSPLVPALNNSPSNSSFLYLSFPNNPPRFSHSAHTDVHTPRAATRRAPETRAPTPLAREPVGGPPRRVDCAPLESTLFWSLALVRPRRRFLSRGEANSSEVPCACLCIRGTCACIRLRWRVMMG